MTQTTHAHVASSTPGRLRVKVHRDQRNGEALNHIEANVVGQTGVVTVDSRPTTGSVIVHYDPEVLSPEGLLDILHDVGVLIHGGLTSDEEIESVEMSPIDPSGHSLTATSIIAALEDLDARVALATGHKVDLKMLFPLTMGTIGIRQLFQNGLGLAEIPAFALLWYAFDSFYKLHRDSGRAPATEAAAEIEILTEAVALKSDA